MINLYFSSFYLLLAIEISGSVELSMKNNLQTRFGWFIIHQRHQLTSTLCMLGNLYCFWSSADLKKKYIQKIIHVLGFDQCQTV